MITGTVPKNLELTIRMDFVFTAFESVPESWLISATRRTWRVSIGIPTTCL